jgi:peptide/nickel transport system permease protein
VARYLAQRIVAYIFVLFVVSIAIFYLIHLLPGRPECVILGAACTPQNIVKVDKLFGLNRPVIIQYFVWFGHLIHGSFGKSFITGESIGDNLLHGLGVDVQLIIISQLMALGVAVPLAFRSARRPGGLFDKSAAGTSYLLLALPPFATIPILVDVFSIHLRIGWATPYSYSPGGSLWHNVLCMIVPAFTIAIGSFVIYYRVLRSDLISTYQEEFITMARSKGLSRRRIVWRHAFRPSSIALLGTLPLVISGLVAGTFIVEFYTGVQGLGYQLIYATQTSDYLMVQDIALVIGIVVIVLNLLVDVAFAFVDPRITRE